jgi:hypothetical protein
VRGRTHGTDGQRVEGALRRLGYHETPPIKTILIKTMRLSRVAHTRPNLLQRREKHVPMAVPCSTPATTASRLHLTRSSLRAKRVTGSPEGGPSVGPSTGA